MALEDRLKDDMKAAMKARDGVRLDTVRLLLADVKNRMIEKMGPLSPEEELALLSKQAKQRVERDGLWRTRADCRCALAAV